MSGDPEPKNWVGRSNRPPQPGCCREPGQAEALGEKGQKLNELLEAYTGTSTGRKRESHLAKAIQPRNDTKTCRWGRRRIRGTQHGGSRYGEDSRDLPGSQSVACAEGVARNLAQPTPAAPTTGAKREGQLNDKESRLIERWESDWFIVTRSKAHAAPKRAKEPTPRHRPHRKPEP